LINVIILSETFLIGIFMNATTDYVLVLDQHPENIQAVAPLLQALHCPAVVAQSPDQVVHQVSDGVPYLVILVGDHQEWPTGLLHDLRHIADAVGGTILSLVDEHGPSWFHPEENPGFDGFLVKPLTSEVLVPLVQAAWVKQLCSLKSCPLPRSPQH
jgi:AmiR/NasT family two-component response regulator